MDIATLFYTLGIAFFLLSFIILVIVLVSVYALYLKMVNLRNALPMRAIAYLQEHNNQSLKALGVTLVGFAVSALKNKIMRKSRDAS